jgi:hypothetical protein
MAQAESLINGQEHAVSNGDEHSRISVAHYNADEVIRQFLGLYNSLDFKEELEDIGITRWQFLRRRKALREFRAICIALWGLALQKSFPNDAGNFFSGFRERAPMLAGNWKETACLHERVNVYIELLAPKKDTDFSPVASQMAKGLALDIEDVPRLRVKLSLSIRNLYGLIFDKLV